MGRRLFRIKQTEQGEASGFSAGPSGSFAPVTLFDLLVPTPTACEGRTPTERRTCSATAPELDTKVLERSRSRRHVANPTCLSSLFCFLGGFFALPTAAQESMKEKYCQLWFVCMCV